MVRDSDSTGRLGLHIAGAAFEAIGFAFREQATSDFGIDAHVEPRVDGNGTGDLLALQVKSGRSYFREANADGWWLRTDLEHANYWINHALPVVLVQVDVDDRRVFWESVTRQTVHLTECGAKVLIPKVQSVDVGSLTALHQLLSPLRGLGQPAAEGAGFRVFLGVGVSGNAGWDTFSRILVRRLMEVECITGWDIIVRARTGDETKVLTNTNTYSADAEDLASIEVDADHHLLTYAVSSREIYHMNLMWHDNHAEIAADGIVQFLMASEDLDEID